MRERYERVLRGVKELWSRFESLEGDFETAISASEDDSASLNKRCQ